MSEKCCIKSNDGRYVTQSGTKPALTTNAELAYVFDSAEEAKAKLGAYFAALKSTGILALAVFPQPKAEALPLAAGHCCPICARKTQQLPYPGDASRFNAFDPDKDIDGTGHMTNGDRAERAARALNEYIGTDRPDESHVRDLICDLLHYAHREGMDPVWQAELGIAEWRDESGNY